jgi:hypothetical protein
MDQIPTPTSTPRLFRPSAIRGEGGGRRRRAAGRHEGGQGTMVIFRMSAMGVHCGPRRSASVRADENAAAGFDAARGSPGRRRPPAARSSLPNDCVNFGGRALHCNQCNGKHHRRPSVMSSLVVTLPVNNTPPQWRREGGAGGAWHPHALLIRLMYL